MERFPYADYNKHFRLIRRTERKRASIFIIFPVKFCKFAVVEQDFGS